MKFGSISPSEGGIRIYMVLYYSYSDHKC